MKIVLDVDTGIDDAVAIAYALASPEAELLGVGTVHGNTEVEKAAENTLKVLKVMGREDVPVALGAHTPLLRPLVTALWVQGDDGLGNSHMPPSGLSVSEEHAVDQIIRLAHEHPGEVTLVPVGRMTNLALALGKDPELPTLIKQVVAMAGTVEHPGNVGAMSEANVWGDPEAAKIVFEAGWPITMVGLDVTMQALLLQKHMDRWQEANTSLTQWLEQILKFYFGYYTASLGYTACAMHDSVAVGIALGLIQGVETHTLPVSVSTHDGPTLGQTLVDRRPLVSRLYTSEGLRELLDNLGEHHRGFVSTLFPTERGKTQVVMKIDAAGFIDQLVERLASYNAR